MLLARMLFDMELDYLHALNPSPAASPAVSPIAEGNADDTSVEVVEVPADGGDALQTGNSFLVGAAAARGSTHAATGDDFFDDAVVVALDGEIDHSRLSSSDDDDTTQHTDASRVGKKARFGRVLSRLIKRGDH
jgi:hypothetical protein